MDLQELHERTGIPRRKLRYCLDHKLVPEAHIEPAAREAGRPRRFAEDVGVGIVCAAHLLDLGLPHDKIRGFLHRLLQTTISGEAGDKPVLAAVFERAVPAKAWFGAAGELRVVVDEFDYDTGWRHPVDEKSAAELAEPPAFVQLDLGRVREQVFGGG